MLRCRSVSPQTTARFRILLALAVLALVATAGCGGPTEPLDFEIGDIDVYVRDTDGQFVNDVVVRLDERNGRHLGEGTTGTRGTPGYYDFVVASGDYRVVMTVPSGYSLPPGHLSSVAVSVVKHQTKTVNFVLKKL